ncbi:MAG: urease accessory protein UreD [Amaricoccus sp.]
MRVDPPPPKLQRAEGRAEVAVSLRDGRVRLDRLFQQGCAKAILPRTHDPVPEAVLINTSGGVTGGDRLAWSLAAGPGAALVATTQAAERVYRSSAGDARIETRLEAGPGASLAWLPQETILFDAGRLDRRLEADIAPDATVTLLETVVLGRAAMGERVLTGALSDQWRLRRGGRLVHAEALFAEGDLARAAAGPATLAGARAFATLVHLAPGAETRLDATRALLDLPGVAAAATAKPGILIARFLAAEALPLRAGLIRFLMAFRAAPLPRVWHS